MNNSHICPYCHLQTNPLAYHEGAADCQQATRELVAVIRDTLPKFTPFISAWEGDAYDCDLDGEEFYNYLATKVGIPERHTTNTIKGK